MAKVGDGEVRKGNNLESVEEIEVERREKRECRNFYRHETARK